MNVAPSPERIACRRANLKWPTAARCFWTRLGICRPLQAKLLRVLQDREFQCVGGTKTVSVNIRIIAATNKDLKQAVAAGEFREDLFYRLNVITLMLPPLRERRDDIPALAKFFLNRHAKEAKRPGMLFSAAAMEAMTRYSWPGNIRELENVIARAVVLSHTETIEPEMLALDAQNHPG
jgi:DNA-binding NtrC family response regulator